MHREYLDRLVDCLRNIKFTYDDNISDEMTIDKAIEDIIQFFLKIKHKGKQIFFVGNGGSAGIAIHMTADFIKNGGMRAQSLYAASLVTCIGNDYGYEYIFSKPLELLAQEGDLLIAISSSGSSSNIINAAHVVKHKGGKVITFTGFKESNELRTLGDYNVYVPVSHYGIVESIHNLLLQQVVDVILEREGGGLE